MIKIRGEAVTNSYLRRLRTGILPMIDRAANQEAQGLRREMIEGLRNQAPGGTKIKPVSEMTRKLRALPKGGGGGTAKKGFIGPLQRGQKRAKNRRKARLGSSKALIVGGDLIGSIAVQRHGKGAFTVGVHKGASGRRSKGDMVSIAAVHEYGSKEYNVTVTSKMAAFSRFLVVMKVLNVPWQEGQVLKKKTPARPFLNPAHEVWLQGAQVRFETNLMQLLGMV